ncbi:MAG: RluA family pseudouridine synthase [Candidatus Vogelbacteria bacterium]|nr:RluA family pseudouridine synthase [Candidatus Vogelbacteria bacterium]
MTKPRIDILYEDKDIVVINKPAGLAVHDDMFGNQKYTVSDWVVEKYPNLKKVGEGQHRPGLVHRLDKDTTGVLIIVKNQEAYHLIKKQFTDREIKKVYLAIVYGQVKKDVGIIDRPIGRSKSDYHAKTTGTAARGELKNAITYFKVLEHFPGYTLLELRPKTGRTHQLRVHLKSISYPIVCDSVYAKGRECVDGLRRQALHAASIEFKLRDGKEIKIEAPLPKDFKDALANLRGL